MDVDKRVIDKVRAPQAARLEVTASAVIATSDQSRLGDELVSLEVTVWIMQNSTSEPCQRSNLVLRTLPVFSELEDYV
jgi:hypothetical protein